MIGGAALSGGQAFAAAASSKAADSSGGTTVGELVVTAEKREQNLQTVPVAISAYTAAKRQLIGIDTIQDMTNFTPGLEYNSSTDRISLRGVGRQTNVLSADASVANYSDGVYETFAVGAGASTLSSTGWKCCGARRARWYGRNAIGGAINEISRHPTTSPYAEIRGTYSNYNHYNNRSGHLRPDHRQHPGSPGRQLRTADAGLDPQRRARRARRRQHHQAVLPRGAGPVEDQRQAGFLGEGRLQPVGQRRRRPGSTSEGWTPFPFQTSEYGNASTELNTGYGCAANGTAVNVVNASPLGCFNPATKSPWLEARTIPYKVDLPYATPSPLI